MPEHDKWRNAQVRAAVAIGIHPLDALAAVNALLAVLPYGADPATYIAPVQAMEQDVSDPTHARDALAAFVGRDDVEPRFKLLLAAGDTHG